MSGAGVSELGSILDSNDLLPTVMRPLIASDCGVSRVCAAWAAAWRIHLHQIGAIGPPRVLPTRSQNPMTILALADGRIVIGYDHNPAGWIEVCSTPAHSTHCLLQHWLGVGVF